MAFTKTNTGYTARWDSDGRTLFATGSTRQAAMNNLISKIVDYARRGWL